MISLFEEVKGSIKRHEGWSPKPYPDPLTGGEPYTFGYGFTYITRPEGESILDNRLIEISRQLVKRVPYFREYARNVQFVLIEMAYALGVSGLLGFRKMLKCLERGDTEGAAKELKDSVFYRRETNRVEDLIDRLRRGK